MTTHTITAARKGRAPAKPAVPQDARAEMAEVMKKLHTIEVQLAGLLESSVCDTLHATGDVAKDINGIVRSLVSSAFEATRGVSQNLLDAGLRSAQTGRESAHDAAAIVQDFGRLATEATRQVMRGAAEGLAEIRSSGALAHAQGRPTHRA